MDWLAENWDQPEEGIWETRGGRQNFTYGRLMTWVAFDRAIRLATTHGRPAMLGRWTSERDRVYNQIMQRGWNPKRQAFVQHYATDVLDSALLRMVRVGFIAPQDPLWLSTLDAMDNELVTDSLVYRYNPSASPDGLRGSEGTFSLCTFSYVDALTRAGRVDQARLIFEKMLTYANHLGLYSEEIALTGEQIGNFPQAFTHLALIDAAVTLDRCAQHGQAGQGATRSGTGSGAGAGGGRAVRNSRCPRRRGRGGTVAKQGSATGHTPDERDGQPGSAAPVGRTTWIRETGLRILPLSVTLLAAAVGIPRFFPDASPRRVVRLGLLAMFLGTGCSGVNWLGRVQCGCQVLDEDPHDAPVDQIEERTPCGSSSPDTGDVPLTGVLVAFPAAAGDGAKGDTMGAERERVAALSTAGLHR